MFAGCVLVAKCVSGQQMALGCVADSPLKTELGYAVAV